MGIWGDIKNGLSGSGGRGSWWNPLKYVDAFSGGKLGDAADSWLDPSADDLARSQRQQNLDDYGGELQHQGRRHWGDAAMLGHEANAEREYLRRIARGEESVSAEQLRQGLQQNVAGQMAMANSARPGSGAMAARQAAMNASRAATGLSGQQAIAGMQERQQAQQALQNAILGQRAQDLGAMQGVQGNALQSWGAGRDNSQQGPSRNEKIAGGVSTFGKILGTIFSDERLKEDIKDGEPDAQALLTGLKGYSYKYKDQKHGKGKQLGIMAQDLEKVVPQAVIDTPEGKMVDGGKLAGALAATLPGLHKRLEKLEKK